MMINIYRLLRSYYLADFLSFSFVFYFWFYDYVDLYILTILTINQEYKQPLLSSIHQLLLSSIHHTNIIKMKKKNQGTLRFPIVLPIIYLRPKSKKSSNAMKRSAKSSIPFHLSQVFTNIHSKEGLQKYFLRNCQKKPNKQLLKGTITSSQYNVLSRPLKPTLSMTSLSSLPPK